MYFKKIFISFCFVLKAFFAFTQGEANMWYFGDYAAIDFNGAVPVSINNNQMYAHEGSASISDAAGNLLFYTNGVNVWDRNHAVMPNGVGLLGNASTTQVLIVAKPNSSNIYYIFTADAFAGANGIRYSEVDMNLNSGMGDVINSTKNTLLHTPSCEKLTAVKHCNNRDVWVTTHDWGTDTFRTYLVTPAGVNTAAVLSKAGIIVTPDPPNNYNAIGQLKASPDGNKLASAIIWLNRFELFDFDRATGMISNGILFPQIPATFGAVGVEFSPDGTKLYGSMEDPGDLYQYDICAGSDTAIINSRQLISATGDWCGNLQLAPDGKIYFARLAQPWLGVINNPNAPGAACNYVNNGISLTPKASRIGLPNIAPYYLQQPSPPLTFTATISCLDAAFNAPAANISNCSGSASAITSAIWDFGDPSSGTSNSSSLNNPTHTFSGAGSYTVTLILSYACGNDSIQQSITISPPPVININSVNASCLNNDGSAIINITPGSGTNPFTYSWSNNQTTAAISGLSAGSYTVLVSDSSSCTAIATTTITQAPIPTGTINPIVCDSFTQGSFTYTLSGLYTQTLSGSAYNGCDSILYINLTVNNVISPPVVNSFICFGQSITIHGTSQSTPGIYTQTFISASTGCDSISSINLSVIPVSSNTISPVACDSIELNGQIFTATGVYSQTLSSASYTGCDSILIVNLTINPIPQVQISGNNTIIKGETIVLTASGCDDYIWSNGTTSSAILINPNQDTIYCVTGITENCIDTACFSVHVIESQCDLEKLFMPNTFSPNNDNQNDTWKIYGGESCTNNFGIIIYNRWGQQVYLSDDVNKSWDGTYKNKYLDPDIFVYQISIITNTGNALMLSGNISLIR